MIFTFMNKKLFSFLTVVCSVCVFAGSVQPVAAQQVSQQNEQSTQTDSRRAGANLADYILAVVQHEPITYAQLKAQMLFIKQSNEQQELSGTYLEQMALQQLITYSALAQRAKEYGLRVDSEMIAQAVSTIASNNNKTVSDLRKDLAQAGVPFSTLEQSIEQQLLIRQLRERLLDPTIYVNNAEIEAYLAQASKAANSADLMISMAHILIAVPENATKKQEEALEAKAQEVYQKARQIKSTQEFINLVNQYSDDPNKTQTGGALGIMPVSSYPDLFVQAVSGLKPGEFAPPVRSGAGYHILFLIDKEQSEMIVEQTHARHILLTVSDTQTEEQAIQILLDDKRKIQTGQVTFEVLAQEQSQDGSAKDGGDLGWVVPGMFVPEFEAVMNQLKPGEISNPVVTRFGVHLIQVLERRDAELTPLQRREVAREAVHQRKIEEAYEQWVQGITGQTYIEMREIPH